MNRTDALIDAALTVQGWQRGFPKWMHLRATQHLGQQLCCSSTWAAIEAEIVTRLMGEAA